MEKHELLEERPNEQAPEKPKEEVTQVKDSEFECALEIILGTDSHENDGTEETNLIQAARNFRKIIDFFVKIFGGAK